jgi:hypothetical protein
VDVGPGAATQRCFAEYNVTGRGFIRLTLLPAIVVAALLAVPAYARGPAFASRAGFLIGINAGDGSRPEVRDLRRVAAVVCVSNPTSPRHWEAAGIRVIADETGPYTSAGISGLNHRSYVRRILSLVRRNPHLFAIEVLNEPGGEWFWGADSESAANRESYAQLLIEVHEALVASFGAARPLELASWDGGHDSSNAWGVAWSHNATALADVDGITSHPYGGTDQRAHSILGNRGLVAPSSPTATNAKAADTAWRRVVASRSSRSRLSNGCTDTGLPSPKGRPRATQPKSPASARPGEGYL